MFGGGGYGDNDDDDYDFDIEGVTKANQVVVKSNSRSIQKSLSNSRVGKEPSDALEKAKLMLSKYGSSKVALSTSVDNSMKYKQKTAAVALEDSDEEEEYFNHNKRKEESDEENESFESFMSSKSSQNDEIMQTNKQQREMKNKKNIHFYSSTYSENSDDRDSGFDDPYSNPPPMASHATSKEIQRNTSYDPSISASYIESVDSFVEESPAVTLPQSAGNKNFHVEEERNDEADDVEEDYEADDDFVEEADASNGSAMKRELSKEDENGENHDDDDTSVGAKPKVFSFADLEDCAGWEDEEENEAELESRGNIVQVVNKHDEYSDNGEEEEAEPAAASGYDESFEEEVVPVSKAPEITLELPAAAPALTSAIPPSQLEREEGLNLSNKSLAPENVAYCAAAQSIMSPPITPAQKEISSSSTFAPPAIARSSSILQPVSTASLHENRPKQETFSARALPEMPLHDSRVAPANNNAPILSTQFFPVASSSSAPAVASLPTDSHISTYQPIQSQQPLRPQEPQIPLKPSQPQQPQHMFHSQQPQQPQQPLQPHQQQYQPQQPQQPLQPQHQPQQQYQPQLAPFSFSAPQYPPFYSQSMHAMPHPPQYSVPMGGHHYPQYFGGVHGLQPPEMNPCHYYPYQSIPHPSFIGNPHHASAYQPSPCYTSYPLQQSQQVRPPVDSKDRTASNTKSSEHINLIRDLLQELKVAKEDASKANQQVVKLLHSLTIASGANSSLGHKGRHDGGSREQSVQTDVPSAMTTERRNEANINETSIQDVDENSLEVAPHMSEERQEVSSNRQNDVFAAISLDDIFAYYPRPQLDSDLRTSVTSMACDNLAKAERNQEDSHRIASILQRLNDGSLYRDHDVLTTLTTSLDARNTYSDSYRLSNAALNTSQSLYKRQLESLRERLRAASGAQNSSASPLSHDLYHKGNRRDVLKLRPQECSSAKLWDSLHRLS